MSPAAIHRVDNVTGLRKLAVELYGWGVALPVHVLLVALRHVVRVEHVGRPASLEGLITCAWHEHLPSVFLACFPATVPTVWMNHPAWFMRPVHLLLGWAGVERLALGSSGNDGKAALQRVADDVAAGAATFLNPDGPRGPAHQLRDGVLELGIRTGRPVVALRFEVRGALRAPTWDRKVFPLPGGLVVVHWSEPLVITAASREEARRTLTAWLG